MLLVPGAQGDPPERISVVIRCHNYGRYLAEAIASVEAQSRPADEIVVVDDGSTDETADVLAGVKVSESRLVCVRRSPARGPAASFNDGVAASTGELIVALDADDRLGPRYLETLAGALGDPSVSIAYCGTRTFGTVTAEDPARPFDPDELLRENMINVSAMFRRSVFDSTGGFRPDFDGLGLEDWEFWVHAVERGARPMAVEGTWLEYRRHPGGSRNAMRRANVLRAHLRMWRLHPRLMRPGHILQWMARSASRNARRLARRVRSRSVTGAVRG